MLYISCCVYLLDSGAAAFAMARSSCCQLLCSASCLPIMMIRGPADAAWGTFTIRSAESAGTPITFSHFHILNHSISICLLLWRLTVEQATAAGRWR
ncbi:hypothetical protein COO60DRAFT_476594 [Scenedesmus sp. NREL 46B-D3]|nr:hypothetical protein COO60DRAFT_476594 [Scenedesmus sp. NREL 46B-D3]